SGELAVDPTGNSIRSARDLPEGKSGGDTSALVVDRRVQCSEPTASDRTDCQGASDPGAAEQADRECGRGAANQRVVERPLAEMCDVTRTVLGPLRQVDVWFVDA